MSEQIEAAFVRLRINPAAAKEKKDVPGSWYDISRIKNIYLLKESGQSSVYHVTYKDISEYTIIFKIFYATSSLSADDVVKKEKTCTDYLRDQLPKYKGLSGEGCEKFILNYDYEELNPNILICQFADELIMDPHRPTHSMSDIRNLLRTSITSDARLSQLPTILYCIRQCGLYHADIKPDNFILTETNVYLIDFGCSIRKEDINSDTVIECSTVHYESPFMKEFNGASIPTKINILIANDLWGLVLTMFYYYVGNNDWFEYTKYNTMPVTALGHFIREDILDMDPTEYLTTSGKGVLPFFKEFIHKPRITAEEYIKFISDMMGVKISEGGKRKNKKSKRKRKKTKRKKTKRKKTKRKRRKTKLR